MNDFSNTIFNVDCKTGLQTLPDQSVNMVVTSPPYYGLRDYGHDEQIGLEETPSAYVQKIVEVFREVKRVLKDDGTVWLNLGDSYSSHKDCKSVGQSLAAGTSRENAHVMDLGKSRVRDTKMLKSQGLKNKDLIGIPWRVAFALQADGWYLRQDIIWNKPNPMPESVTDRCTKSHEYIFLLSKSERYYFDNEAIKEDSVGTEYDRTKRQQNRMNGAPSLVDGRNQLVAGKSLGVGTEKRNKRSVWTINTAAYADAHFATFPEDLIVPCILAGCPESGLVLDPFMGAGTTAVVARKLNRNYVGFELNADYVKIAEDRIYKQIGLFL